MQKQRYFKVITYKEFEKLAEENNLIYPFNYKNISKSTLGIIANNTFNIIEFSDEAKKTF